MPAVAAAPAQAQSPSRTTMIAALLTAIGLAALILLLPSRVQ